MADFSKSIVYQIYPKSFCDSDGDGVGDLAGITGKLDYLETLGVDYLWLTPFFCSPQNDNGYDVSDYQNIEPMFGTMDDLEQLIAEAEKRGIGLMLDMVFNHTSTSHEWFKRALAGEKKYQDYYIFKEGSRDQVPTNWQSKFGGSAWEYVESLGKWYLHLFDVSQADLNWENPEVREELKNVIRFWKKKGIQGFRFDVVNLISKPEIFEDDHQGDGRRFYTDGPHVHEFLKELVQDTGIQDMITVGEMSSTSLEQCCRYANPKEKELSMCFNFHHLKVDYKDGNKWELKQPDYRELKTLFETWQIGMTEHESWNALFWDNHDQPRAVSRFGNDKEYWKQSAKMLATMIHLMRGTPYIYQGDELGMTNAKFTDIEEYVDVESRNYYDILLHGGLSREEALHVLEERSRDNGRTPMQWNRNKHAGFMQKDSANKPWIKIPEYKPEANAEEELNDPDSIFNYYRKLIELRKTNDLVSSGSIRFHETENEKLISYERFCESEMEQQKLLIVCSFSDQAETFHLPYTLEKNHVLLNNYGKDGISVSDGEMELRPYECYVVECF